VESKGKPWQEVDQEILAAAIRNASEETRKEIAQNLRLIL